MALSVTGLEKDFYYANNTIFVQINESAPFDYFTVKIGSFETMTLTPISGKVRIDISSYIKSLLPKLNGDNNLISMSINVMSHLKLLNATQIVSSTTITKYFLRGGIRGNRSNVNAQPNVNLKVTENLPYWKGYFRTVSFIDTLRNPNTIRHSLLNPDTIRGVEQRKIKGCNPTYVMFLNSLGGYSYWMFEGITDQQKNSNLGVINNNVTIDLGNTFEQEIELYSKVPKAYIALMQDLIISPEIYIYSLGESGVEWTRYTSKNNTLEVNPAKNAQSVKIKLEPFNQFNPSIIWQ